MNKSLIYTIFCLLLTIVVVWMTWSIITPVSWIGHGTFFGNDTLIIMGVSTVWGWIMTDLYNKTYGIERFNV